MAGKFKAMLNRESTDTSGMPLLTVAVLQDELERLRKDVCQEMSRLFEEQKDACKGLQKLFEENLEPRAQFGVIPKASGQPVNDEPSVRRRTTTFKRQTTRVFQDLEWISDDEDEDKEPHPFLKRNPRINGTSPSSRAGARASIFESHSHSNLWQHTSSTTVDLEKDGAGRFQIVSQGDNMESAASISKGETVDLAQPLNETPEDPCANASNISRELRLSRNEASRHTRTESTTEAQTRGPWAKHIVHSKHFEHLVCVMVLLNAVILGVETESQWKKRREGESGSHAVSFPLEVIEAIFCVVFATELLLRIVVDGCEFFVGREWAWNLYDLIAIGLQVLEQASNMCTFFSDDCSYDMHNTHLTRDMNILRVIRVTRLIRLVRLLEELRMIVASICSSMFSLGWTFLLLMMLLYSLALFFTEVVLQNIHRSAHKDDMEYWFGGLGRTFLTMFECIFGGVSWDEVLNPLIEDISGLLSVVFCLYIAFCVLAMMNMATGVFVDNAMRKAQEDKDTNTAKRISHLFFNDPVLGQAESITMEQFCSKIDTPEMQDYFKAINVDPSEAMGLYRLLDADDSGSIDAAEMVAGCLRLRGGAKALELSLLMHEVNRMGHRTTVFQARVEKALAWIVEMIELQPHSVDRQAAPTTMINSKPFFHGDSVDITCQDGPVK